MNTEKIIQAQQEVFCEPNSGVGDANNNINYSIKDWRTLDMQLINCEINNILTWSEKMCINK